MLPRRSTRVGLRYENRVLRRHSFIYRFGVSICPSICCKTHRVETTSPFTDASRLRDFLPRFAVAWLIIIKSPKAQFAAFTNRTLFSRLAIKQINYADFVQHVYAEILVAAVESEIRVADFHQMALKTGAVFLDLTAAYDTILAHWPPFKLSKCLPLWCAQTVELLL